MMTASNPMHLITAEEEQLLTEQKNQACFFTGHRTIGAAWYQPLSELLRHETESLVYQGYTMFYSGAARGFDLMAAAAVLALKRDHPQIRLILAIPCRGQSVKWRPEERQLYDSICEMGETYLLAEQYDSQCMQRRNRFLVDHAVTGVAYDTGVQRSGTGQTISYAQKKHVPIINLAPMLTDAADKTPYTRMQHRKGENDNA